ncbi:MAG: hypothetical protein ACR2GY_08715 [Phycisphaerales bacterium]
MPETFHEFATIAHTTHLAEIFLRPAFAVLAVIAIGVILAGLSVSAYFRSWSLRRVASALLLVMRLATIALLTWVLLGPSRMLPAENDAVVPGELVILLDTSESMLTADCAGASRIDHATDAWLNLDAWAALGEIYHVRLLGFDESLEPLARSRLTADVPLADGASTRLVDAVNQSIVGGLGFRGSRPPASSSSSKNSGRAILLLSDGRDTADTPLTQAAVVARGWNIPVHTVCVGGDTRQKDIALVAAPLADSLLSDESGEILVKIYQSGFDHQTVEIELSDGMTRTRTELPIREQGAIELTLPIEPRQPGVYEYSISIAPDPDEVETSNNQHSVFIEVHRERVRVLLLEGQPYWDTKFLAQSLRADDRIELAQITQVTPSKREVISSRGNENQEDLQVPDSVDAFAAWDVIILGHGIEQLLDVEAAQSLRDYVTERGGKVIFARGRASEGSTSAGRALATVLAEIEPVSWDEDDLNDAVRSDVPITLVPGGVDGSWLSSSQGVSDPAGIFAQLPGFEAVPMSADAKPATIVHAAIAAGDGSEAGQPAIVSMRSGSGQVVGILGEGLWRWRLLERQKPELAGFFDIFWSNMVRWLALGGDFPPGQNVALQLASTTVRVGEPVAIDVTYRTIQAHSPGDTLEVAGPDGAILPLTLRQIASRETRYRAEFSPTSTGVHAVTLHTSGAEQTALTRRFSAFDLNVERLHAEARPLEMRMLAEETGGMSLRPEDFQKFVDTQTRARLAAVVPPRPEFIWDRSWILALLLMWMGCEWLLRRAAGML